MQYVDHKVLVSIIVPVYNSEQFLRECLESICKQTHSLLQIICVDDGSVDASWTILQEFASRDKRFTVIRQENKGQGSARNKGLDIAAGEWIAGLDADDYLEPDAIEYALSLVTGEVDAVCYSSCVETLRETRQDEVDYLRNKQDGVLTDPAELLEQTNVYFWNKLWRRSFIEQYRLRFTEGLWYEDSAFAYCAFPLLRGCAFGTRCVHHYRMHGQSIMTQTFQKHPRAIEHVDQLAHVLDFYRRHEVQRRCPVAACLVFRKLYGACMAHIPKHLQKVAMKKVAELVRHYELRRLYPLEGSINAARWIPWYLRPFYKVTYSKREYRFFWVPFFSIKLYAAHAVYRVLGIPLGKKSFNVENLTIA